MDPANGRVIDAHHPQHDTLLTGRVLVMHSARGSSSSSSILAEAVRAGTAPAAILLGEADLILPIGAEVAAELYSRQVPILLLAPEDLARIPNGTQLTIDKVGRVSLPTAGA